MARQMRRLFAVALVPFPFSTASTRGGHYQISATVHELLARFQWQTGNISQLIGEKKRGC